jgi:glycosyltransferase involved in cell wall biosynthesis
MKKIFAVSKLSSAPSQAVSTIRFNIFKRLDADQFAYFTTADSNDLFRGSIIKIPVTSKNKYFQFLEKIYWMHKLKPDILIFTGDPFELIFYFLRPRKALVVTHVNGAMPADLAGYPYHLDFFLYHSLALLIKRSDFIITIAEHCKKSLAPFRGLNSVFVVYNGVDLEQFNPEKRDKDYLYKKFNLDFSRPTVAFVGSLIKRKRPDLVLALAEASPSIDFIFVGGVSAEYDLSVKMKSLKNVRYIPSVDRNDLSALFASVDIFCFPALYEGFGMVVAEAMASGCAVVASDHQGPAELIKNGEDGILIGVGSGEVEQFDKAIHSLLNDPALCSRITGNARKKAEEMFNWDNLAKEWKEALETMTAKKQNG